MSTLPGLAAYYLVDLDGSGAPEIISRTVDEPGESVSRPKWNMERAVFWVRFDGSIGRGAVTESFLRFSAGLEG